MKKLSMIFIGFCLLLNGCEMNAELWDSVDSPDSAKTRSIPDGIQSVYPSSVDINVNTTTQIQVEFNMDVAGFISSNLVLNNCNLLPCTPIPGAATYSSLGGVNQAVFNLSAGTFLERNTTYQVVLSSPAPSYTWNFTTKDNPKVVSHPIVRDHGGPEAIYFVYEISEPVNTGPISITIKEYSTDNIDSAAIITTKTFTAPKILTSPSLFRFPCTAPHNYNSATKSLEVILKNVRSTADSAWLGGISSGDQHVYTKLISEIQ
jgi:hypothetical protein